MAKYNTINIGPVTDDNVDEVLSLNEKLYSNIIKDINKFSDRKIDYKNNNWDKIDTSTAIGEFSSTSLFVYDKPFTTENYNGAHDLSKPYKWVGVRKGSKSSIVKYSKIDFIPAGRKLPGLNADYERFIYKSNTYKLDILREKIVHVGRNKEFSVDEFNKLHGISYSNLEFNKDISYINTNELLYNNGTSSRYKNELKKYYIDYAPVQKHFDSTTEESTVYTPIYSYDTEVTNITSPGNTPFYAYYSDGQSLWVYVKFDKFINVVDDSVLEGFSGWIKIFDDRNTVSGLYYGLNIYTNKTTVEETYKKAPTETNNNNNNNNQEEKQTELTYNEAWDNSSEYNNALYAEESKSSLSYWKNMFGTNMGSYTLKSHQSIIGLPLQFMPNVDMRVGASYYGKQYMEDILYDMNIACIKPGGPVLNPNLDENAQYSDDLVTKGLRTVGKISAWADTIKDLGVTGTLKQALFSLFKGGSARFYSFQSDYTHYTHYVNTLCHLFITYLNIGDKEYITSNGTKKKYALYSDEPAEIESDGGLGLHTQFGWDNAVYMYYSPESSLSQSFSNSTTQSSLNATLTEASSAVKEFGFFMNAAGMENGRQVISSIGQDLVANTSTGFLGRLFGNAAEGATTVLAGNNLSLPEIYSDSDTTVQHSFKVKLVSPYGDPESVFLYVLRPLARMLAFSLPRQYGPNSYQSPFIIQAFSKGQFNCQLGIVTELSITRCGNGGESHTISHIPTELEVSITIQDMYEKVFLSNEYFGNSTFKAILGAGVDLLTGGTDNVGNGIGTAIAQAGMTMTAARLLFNNVGLIDFVASLCGANLNQQTYMSGWTLIWNMMKNRTAEIIGYDQNDGWVFPQWEKTLNDAYNDAVSKLYSTVTTTH